VERTEVAEIEALRSMFAVVPDDIAADFGVATLELDDAFAGRVASMAGATEVNHAVGVSTPAQLDALADFYGAIRHAVSPAPGADLDAALRERGYEPGYAWMKFSRGVDALPDASTDLEIVEVGADRGLDFGRAAVDGYGLPQRVSDWFARLPGHGGWHCFVAYADGEPAATGALHIFEDVGWTGIGATRAEFRRRGAQSAILAARIERAAELGCTEHPPRRLRAAVPTAELRAEGDRPDSREPREDDRLHAPDLNPRIVCGDPTCFVRRHVEDADAAPCLVVLVRQRPGRDHDAAVVLRLEEGEMLLLDALELLLGHLGRVRPPAQHEHRVRLEIRPRHLSCCASISAFPSGS
jgi:GNAT superfamily N-acetyltransferase